MAIVSLSSLVYPEMTILLGCVVNSGYGNTGVIVVSEKSNKLSLRFVNTREINASITYQNTFFITISSICMVYFDSDNDNDKVLRR